MTSTRKALLSASAVVLACAAALAVLAADDPPGPASPATAVAVAAFLPVVALATWQTVEVVRHSELFAQLRADAELEAGDGGVTGWFARLVLCPFCLSVNAGFLLSLLADTGVLWSSGRVCPALGVLPLAAVAGLAASRLANLGNDLTRDKCRTPGRSTKSQLENDEQRDV